MVRAELVSAYFFAIYVATVPYSNAAEAKMVLLYPTKPSSETKMMLLYPTRPPSETKMMLLYPTKRSRKPKWCYCTLQNRRGDKNDATVPYSNPHQRLKWRY